MDSSHAQNAMTEIALALAMGFFCIMILALVSMGVASDAPSDRTANHDMAVLAPSESEGSRPDDAEPVIVIHHAGTYLTPDLTPVVPEDLGAEETIILAVDPALSMTEALKAQAPFKPASVTLSPLNPEWLARLAAR